jgi:hypothetical protein
MVGNKMKFIIAIILVIGLALMLFALNPSPCGLTTANGMRKVGCSCYGVTAKKHGYKGKFVLNTIDVCYGITTTKLCSPIPDGQVSTAQYDEPVLCSSLTK